MVQTSGPDTIRNVHISGVVVTIMGNMILIPYLNYFASAWTTLACYLAMTILCYTIGKRFYEFRIEWKKITIIFLLTLGSYFLYEFFWHESIYDKNLGRFIRIFFFAIPLFIYFQLDKKEIKKVARGHL